VLDLTACNAPTMQLGLLRDHCMTLLLPTVQDELRDTAGHLLDDLDQANAALLAIARMVDLTVDVAHEHADDHGNVPGELLTLIQSFVPPRVRAAARRKNRAARR